MLFSEPVFLFVFLPTVLLLYFIVPPQWRNGLLLVFSLLFYAWGEPKYILLMLGIIALNYYAAMVIDRTSSSSVRKIALIVSLTANIGALAVFKYLGLILRTVVSLFEHIGLPRLPVIDIALPIGISFFTFQAMSYLIDVYRREVPAQASLFRLALYISLFPQLIAGPIVRYSSIAGQLESRDISLSGFASGSRRFIVGLAKKLLIADALGRLADPVFDADTSGLSTTLAWIGLLAYTGQIYFDFSGYSDMAMGLGQMFGFQFEENVNYPYISRSITEFWRRWHISLSTWFRDYLYISLGGNRAGRATTYRNLVIVFFGLWAVARSSLDIFRLGRVPRTMSRD